MTISQNKHPGAMKHTTNPRRGRNRGNGKRHTSVRSQTFESNGPDGKIRGTAQQVLDRYLALARDASSSGDPISAEGFYQHAEHYHRLLHAEGAEGDRARAKPPAPNGEAPAEDDGADAAEGAEETVGRLPF